MENHTQTIFKNLSHYFTTTSASMDTIDGWFSWEAKLPLGKQPSVF